MEIKISEHQQTALNYWTTWLGIFAGMFGAQCLILTLEFRHTLNLEFLYFAGAGERIQYVICGLGLAAIATAFSLIAAMLIVSGLKLLTGFRQPRISGFIPTLLCMLCIGFFWYHVIHMQHPRRLARWNLVQAHRIADWSLLPLSFIGLLLLARVDREKFFRISSVPNAILQAASLLTRLMFFPLGMLATRVSPRKWISLAGIALVLSVAALFAFVTIDFRFIGKAFRTDHRSLALFSTLCAWVAGIQLVALSRALPIRIKTALVTIPLILALVSASATAVIFKANPRVRTNTLLHTELHIAHYDIIKALMDMDRNGFIPILNGDNPATNMDDSISSYPLAIKKNTPRVRQVLLLTIDACRADHCNFLGYSRETFPVVSRLAEKGVSFTNGYCPSNSTWNHFARMIYGLTNLPSQGSPRSVTFEVPDAAGIQVGLFPPWISPLPSGLRGQELLKSLPQPEFDDSNPHQSSLLQPTLFAFLSQCKDRPFFAMAHILDPHSPYISKPEHDIFHDGTDPRMDDYDGTLRQVDSFIGDIMAHLETLGIADQVLIAISADHGEAFFEHGFLYHGLHLYEEMTHVPLVLLHPSLKARTIDEPVSLERLLPTFFHALGVGNGEHFMYEDLWPALTAGTAISPQPVYMVGNMGSFGMRDGKWKLLWNQRGNTFELFDLDKDPQERLNRTNEDPEVLSRMRRKLCHWAKQQQERMRPYASSRKE